jgi:predicted acetyltransferase
MGDVSMMSRTPLEQPLGDGLVMRTPATEQDVEHLAVFNGHIHGPGVAAMTRALLSDHPHTRPDYWLFVDDEAAGRVVSALCLLPWTLRYQDVMLRAGEMGIVGTLEAYRGRGLIRRMNERFTALLREDRFDLSHIQGIPYFYHQFGYEYAMPLEADWRVEPYLIPAPQPSDAAYRFRAATPDDIAVLARLYDEAARRLDISAERDVAVWRYLLGPSMITEMVAETLLVLGAADQVVGYLRIARHGFGSGLIVSETSLLTLGSARAVLRMLKALATERDKPYIRLNLPDHSLLARVAQSHGARRVGAYAWQIRLVDVPALLLKLAPVLWGRLAASDFAGLSGRLRLNLYRQSFDLVFEHGRLVAVEQPQGQAVGELRLPPPLLAPLLLGYRSLTELAQAHHDVSASGLGAELVGVLFPAMSSFLYTIY